MKNEIENLTKAKWNGHGMSIQGIEDILIEFYVCVIKHKVYQASKLNNVPCVGVDLGYKIVKKDHSYDLAKL